MVGTALPPISTNKSAQNKEHLKKGGREALQCGHGILFQETGEDGEERKALLSNEKEMPGHDRCQEWGLAAAKHNTWDDNVGYIASSDPLDLSSIREA